MDFEVNQTKIKGGCQSGKKVANSITKYINLIFHFPFRILNKFSLSVWVCGERSVTTGANASINERIKLFPLCI